MYQVAYVSEQHGWEAVFNVLVLCLFLSALMVSQMAIRDFGYLKNAGNPQLESLQGPIVDSQQQTDAAYAPPVLDGDVDQESAAGEDDATTLAGTQ